MKSNSSSLVRTELWKNFSNLAFRTETTLHVTETQVLSLAKVNTGKTCNTTAPCKTDWLPWDTTSCWRTLSLVVKAKWIVKWKCSTVGSISSVERGWTTTQRIQSTKTTPILFNGTIYTSETSEWESLFCLQSHSVWLTKWCPALANQRACIRLTSSTLYSLLI